MCWHELEQAVTSILVYNEKILESMKIWSDFLLWRHNKDCCLEFLSPCTQIPSIFFVDYFIVLQHIRVFLESLE